MHALTGRLVAELVKYLPNLLSCDGQSTIPTYWHTRIGPLALLALQVRLGDVMDKMGFSYSACGKIGAADMASNKWAQPGRSNWAIMNA